MQRQEVFTVAQFCEVYSVSRAKLYQLIAAGTGPVIIKLGRRTLISREAADNWRRSLESANQAADA